MDDGLYCVEDEAVAIYPHLAEEFEKRMAEYEERLIASGRLIIKGQGIIGSSYIQLGYLR